MASDEVVLDHVREVEDLVESLLDSHHPVIVAEHNQRTSGVGKPAPTAPGSTLITVARTDLAEVVAALDALDSMLPRPATSTEAPRGDLRAHVEKAQEIAREVLPQKAQSDRPVGTSGEADGMATVDRTALERLEVEINAMERVAPRALR